MASYTDRIARVQQSLRERGLAAAVFAPTDQMRYLTGWCEGGHERLIGLFLPANGDPVFVVPRMNAPQALQNPAGIKDVRGWEDSGGWHGIVKELLSEWQNPAGGLAIDDELASVHLLDLQSIAPMMHCVAAGELMAGLREIKSVDEIDAMKRSGAVTDSVYEEALGVLREGISEIEVQSAIEEAYKRHSTRPEFALVCFGPNSALPHHSTGSARLKRGDMVILDIGCKIDHYASDITRTVAFGEPDQEAKQVYEVVYRAHMAAFEAGKPGAACEDVDAAARAVITEAGYGPYFIHRTGHGIGLSTHEPPYIVEGNRQPLKTGMCFSDEPGVYLKDRFGVRIENIVTVTATRLRYLNAPPPAELPIITA